MLSFIGSKNLYEGKDGVTALMVKRAMLIKFINFVMVDENRPKPLQ